MRASSTGAARRPGGGGGGRSAGGGRSTASVATLGWRRWGDNSQLTGAGDLASANAALRIWLKKKEHGGDGGGGDDEATNEAPKESDAGA